MIAMQHYPGRVAILVLAMLAAQACSDPSDPVGPASVSLSGTLPASAPVGSAVTPLVLVRDGTGNPVVGALVGFEVSAGGGTVSSTAATTASTGIASPGPWTLGPTPGANTLIVRVAGASDLSLTVEGLPLQPASITVVEGADQVGQAGSALSDPVRVRVADDAGNGLADVAVEFAVTGGGGSLSGASQVTDETGTAALGSWVLGTQAGPQTLSVSAPGLTATIMASAVAGPAASVTAVAGDGQEAPPNGLVAVVPQIRVADQFDNGIAGMAVTFAALDGGDVAVAGATTDEDGVAGPGAWMLGPEEGPNTLRAAVAGLEPAVLTATAGGAPVSPIVMQKFAGDQTTCIADSTGCSFTVQLTTRVGKPAAGAAVMWSAGDATLAATTNAKGRSTASNLITEAADGTATQRARLDSSGEEVVFSYRFVPGGEYDIDLRFIGTATPSQQAIFAQASKRWEEIITGDLTPVALSLAANQLCNGLISHPPIDETVDDLLIYIEVLPIDGVGDTLGMAGPCLVRSSNGLPVAGVMRFDEADVDAMEAGGSLYRIVLHEMGHILGFGTIWEDMDLITGVGGDAPFFTGPRARSGFVLSGGTPTTGVPVENCRHVSGQPRGGCRETTRDRHWHEGVFDRELMTGYISGGDNPLSAVTIASLMDLGYQVNFGAADAYALPGTTAGLIAAQPFHEERIELREPPMPRPTVVDDRR